MTTFVQMSKWHVPALLKYILSWFMFTYSFFVNLERDKSKAHCQNRLVIHIYRILLLTKFSNVLLFWRFYFSLKNLHSSDKFCFPKKKLFNQISYVMNIWRIWRVPVPWSWFTYKRTYFPIYKKESERVNFCKTRTYKKINFQKCHTRVIKKRWPDSQYEQLFPWLLPLVLFPPDLYPFLQLISNYLPPLTLKLWDLPRDILKFIIFVNIQLVLTEVFLEK